MELPANDVKELLKASYMKIAPQKVGDWDLDQTISRETARVYTNPNGKIAVIHRGTESTAKDWGNNLHYAIGNYKNTDRYKKSKDVQQKAFNKYGKDRVYTLGHSQGGILSHSLGKEGKQVINVNSASKFERPNKNEVNIRSSGDIVSMNQSLNSVLYPKLSKNDITIKAGSINPLKEHNTDILDRIDKPKKKKKKGMFGF